MEDALEKLSLNSCSCPKILHSSSKLVLTTEASFGDGMDIFQEEKITSDGGTIIFTIDVRRQFESGDFVMHILDTDAKNESGLTLPDKVAILCLDQLCPIKIHNQLRTSNMGADFSSANYMNRYDWMHLRNWSTGSEELWTKRKDFVKVITKEVLNKPLPESYSESDGDHEPDDEVAVEDGLEDFDFRSLVYFVDATRTTEIGAGKFFCKQENDLVWEMQNEDYGLIGFIIKAKGSGLTVGDWNYGCVLVDKNTKKCFAFVFGDYYTETNYQLYTRDASTLDICKIKYTLDKSIFQK